MFARIAFIAIALAVCQANPQYGYSNLGNAGYRGGYGGLREIGGYGGYRGIGAYGGYRGTGVYGGYGGYRGIGAYGGYGGYGGAGAYGGYGGYRGIGAYGGYRGTGTYGGYGGYRGIGAYGGYGGNQGFVGYGGLGGYGGYGGQSISISHAAAPIVSRVAAVPVLQKVAAVPVVSKVAAIPVEQYAPPHYQYEYSVNDQHTGDIKSQHEERVGDNTRGYYSLHEPDGTVRTVHYTVDKHSGFNAVVEKTGHAVHPQPVAHHAAIPIHKTY